MYRGHDVRHTSTELLRLVFFTPLTSLPLCKSRFSLPLPFALELIYNDPIPTLIDSYFNVSTSLHNFPLAFPSYQPDLTPNSCIGRETEPIRRPSSLRRKRRLQPRSSRLHPLRNARSCLRCRRPRNSRYRRQWAEQYQGGL
jgi:hypothetical protein